MSTGPLTNGWFGQPWPSAAQPAPVCDSADDRIDVPVGATCQWCEEPIGGTDSGIFMPFYDGEQVVRVYDHVECWLRQIVGSLAHQHGRCSCHGGVAADPPAMTVRDAARTAVAAYYRANPIRA